MWPVSTSNGAGRETHTGADNNLRSRSMGPSLQPGQTQPSMHVHLILVTRPRRGRRMERYVCLTLLCLSHDCEGLDDEEIDGILLDTYIKF